MKKFLLVGLVLVLLGAGFGLWSWLNRPAWSTRDPEVLALVEQARGELNKLYYREAAEILEKALTKDPDSFAARYFLQRAYSGLGRSREAREQLELLKQQDPATLTPRERMLLDLLVLRRSGDREAFLSRLLEYQAQYPREVELTRLLALTYQEAGRSEEAEKWGRKTLELDANDALAYNILGYIELARGRFVQAEEQFRKYAFIAPDQANPHDSLGELFLITGRFEEAEQELQAATKANPRFYPAWRHLADLAVLRGDPQLANAATVKLALALDLKPEERAVVEATMLGLLGFFHDNSSLLLGAAEAIAKPRDEAEFFVVHAASCARGDWAQAEAVEASVEQAVASGTPGSRSLGRLLPLLRTHRLWRQGRWQEALLWAQQAEAACSFVNVWQAESLLAAQCWKALALARLGRKQEARTVLGHVRATNPRFPLLAQVEGKL